MAGLVEEVKLKLAVDEGRVLAYCTVVIGGVAIHDIKLIDGERPFISMPSRKLLDKCTRCGGKNHLLARYCNSCGERLADGRAGPERVGPLKLYADIAHPIRSEVRDLIQRAVLAEYDKVTKAARGG